MDVSKYADVDEIETMGEVHSRLFSVYVDAAMHELSLVARRHGIAPALVLQSFIAMRQAEATEAVAAGIEQLVDGFSRRDGDEPPEPWRNKE